MRNFAICCGVVAALLGLPGRSRADVEDLPRPERYAVAVTEMVGIGYPWIGAALTDKLTLWRIDLPFPADQVPELYPGWLDDIVDKRPVPDLRPRPVDPVDLAFHKAYCQALAFAYLVPQETFRASATEHPEVVFAHLYNRPEAYRGKVIRVEGRLARLRQYEAPEAAQRMGYSDKYVYEGWIFGKAKGTNPYSVIFPPPLPEGLKAAENLDVPVTFDGYFLALIKYRAGSMDRYTPLLIGPPVTLKQRIQDTPAVPLSNVFVISIVGFVVGLAGLLVFLNLWFRRGDQRVRSYIADIQGAKVIEAMEAGEETGFTPERPPAPPENGSVSGDGLPKDPGPS